MIPVVDVSSLLPGAAGDARPEEAARLIGRACAEHGFFYARNHGIPAALVRRLQALGHAFFEQDEETKSRAALNTDYRGYFRLGGELTGGRPDWKAGLYFGAELGAGHPLPMHGPNVWPELPGLREAVEEYMAAAASLGHSLMEGVALSLGLERDFFRREFTSEPFTPFRLFYYPCDEAPPGTLGVGEHTDYGVLTLLLQDDSGGLQVRARSGEWVDAPPVDGTLVVNIGDMLETWTSGRYRAAPHRVLKQERGNRLSAPFFFDPNFSCVVRPLGAPDGAPGIHYGEYIAGKVRDNFPAVAAAEQQQQRGVTQE